MNGSREVPSRKSYQCVPYHTSLCCETDYIPDLDDDASEDSASDSEESEGEMDTDDAAEPISLVDLASRESAIQVEITPARLINQQTSTHFCSDGKPTGYTSTIQQACIAGVLEAWS